ncbi:MAG: hypothetical protein GX878_07335 [Firmicutes bacterium]|nr:hypothetical protein [Bacillota bacterium]
MKGFKKAFDHFEIITPQQVEQIHKSIMRVLWETGVTVEDDEALQLLSENGCKVERSTKRVKIPEELVEKCLANAPSSFEIVARDSKNNCTFASGGPTYFAPSIGMNTLDLDTWKPRRPTRKEYYEYARILDSLPNVHSMIAFPWFGFENVPQCMCLLESNAAKIRCSTKIQQEGTVLGNDKWNIEMAKATDQDLQQLLNPAAPLSLQKETVDQIRLCTDADMPFHFATGTTIAATGPATLSGSIVVDTAASLAGIVLAQLIKPGARVWVGGMMMVQNMRTGSPAFGNIGNSLADIVFNQIWRKYGIPTWTSSSAWTSSKAIDFQAAYEVATGALLGALGGSTVVILHGGLTGELTAHPIKAILDDDIAGMIGRLLEGVTVNEETLAVDLINEVGPLPGNFLTTKHTRKWWKSEQYVPLVADTLTYPEWATLGHKKAIDHARERMEQLLNEHKIVPLTDTQEDAIETILKEAREYYRKNGLISDHEWHLYQKDISSPNYPFA